MYIVYDKIIDNAFLVQHRLYCMKVSVFEVS